MKNPDTILIVDDFESIRGVIADTLKRNGFEVIQAENGKQAMDILYDEEQKVDLVLSDYNMPEMNGFQFLQEIKSNDATCNIPFVLLTSETNNEKKKKAKEAGLDAWIQKPYKIEAFINQINYCIEKSRSNV